ncbi:MAG TPA: hypothetical protein VFT22_07230 [Kofleriaceae bacterium]|nr:hypothetical protein [Kofleriaceae bacterium]
MTATVTAPCTACTGTGRRALSPKLAETLRAVPAAWTRTAEVGAVGKLRHVAQTALINRLNALVAAGLIERSMEGKRAMWRRKTETNSRRGTAEREFR